MSHHSFDTAFEALGADLHQQHVRRQRQQQRQQQGPREALRSQRERERHANPDNVEFDQDDEMLARAIAESLREEEQPQEEEQGGQQQQQQQQQQPYRSSFSPRMNADAGIGDDLQEIVEHSRRATRTVRPHSQRLHFGDLDEDMLDVDVDLTGEDGGAYYADRGTFSRESKRVEEGDEDHHHVLNGNSFEEPSFDEIDDPELAAALRASAEESERAAQREKLQAATQHAGQETAAIRRRREREEAEEAQRVAHLAAVEEQRLAAAVAESRELAQAEAERARLRAEADARKAERNAQDWEFEQALERDRQAAEAERRKREDEVAREEAEQIAKEDAAELERARALSAELSHEQRLSQLEADVLRNLPEPPDGQADGGSVVDLAIRLPDGRRITRRFAADTTTVSQLRTYVDLEALRGSQSWPVGTCTISTAFPKTSITDTPDATLGALGLVGRALVNVDLP